VISVEVRAGLMVRRGKLAPEGVAVHAATFLRERRIVLDEELLRRPKELRRIFLHELLHFVWWKLGNPRRLSWEALLAAEMGKRARGELGWSAEIRKNRLTARDVAERTRAWREYCCESFCDSGASILYQGVHIHKGGTHDEFDHDEFGHDEFTLAARFRTARERWFGQGDIIEDEEQLVQFVEPRDGRSGFVWGAGMPCLLPISNRARSIRKGFKRQESRARL
jgi:hypothetical protein